MVNLDHKGVQSVMKWAVPIWHSTSCPRSWYTELLMTAGDGDRTRDPVITGQPFWCDLAYALITLGSYYVRGACEPALPFLWCQYCRLNVSFRSVGAWWIMLNIVRFAISNEMVSNKLHTAQKCLEQGHRSPQVNKQPPGQTRGDDEGI